MVNKRKLAINILFTWIIYLFISLTAMHFITNMDYSVILILSFIFVVFYNFSCAISDKVLNVVKYEKRR